MVLAGFADFDRPDPLLRDRYRGEPEHVAWSVPPQAAAALSDHVEPEEWLAGPRDEEKRRSGL